MLYCLITSIVFIFFFPFLIRCDLYYSKCLGKVLYRISIFNFLKINGGYISANEKGIIIHIKNKKAKYFAYYKLLSLRENAKPLKDYHLLNISYAFDVGYNDYDEYSSILPTLYVIHNKVVGKIIDIKKPYIDYNADLNIVFDDDNIRGFLKIQIILNIFLIFLSIVKIMMEKIVYAKK